MVTLRGDHFITKYIMEKSKGLGDTVKKITKATGLKKITDAVSKATGKDCGCDKRRDTLNRLFPYNYK